MEPIGQEVEEEVVSNQVEAGQEFNHEASLEACLEARLVTNTKHTGSTSRSEPKVIHMFP